MLRMSYVNVVKCQHCQMSTMQCQMSTKSNLPRSVEICPDQSRSYEICQMSTKLSKCQPNCQNVNQIVKLSQYQMSCVIRVCRFNLAHQCFLSPQEVKETHLAAIRMYFRTSKL